MSGKAFITAAVTGAIHVPTMSEYLPITPDEIVEDAVKAHEAGAAVVHIHARDPKTGQPSPDLKLYREIVEKIKARTNLVICLTTGAALGMDLESRVAVVPEFKPEIASFNFGSLNFALYPLLDKYKNFKYQWEKDYFQMTEDFAFANTFKTLKYFAKTMYENGSQPELEIYDVGQLNNVVQMIKEGYLKKPIYLQFIMGILGGIPATVENLVFLVRTAEKTIGDFTWSVCGTGKNQLPIAAAAIAMGGNVRVGLEDSIYASKGVLAKSSAEQVAKAAEMMRILSIDVADSDEVRKIFGLKGLDKVNF